MKAREERPDIVAALIDVEHDLTRAPNDPVHYPGTDPSGYFTTVDIVRALPGFTMEKLQDWIKRGYVKPMHRIEVGRGLKSFFTPSQVLLIGFFEKLVDLGIPRKDAWTWVKTFQNLRVGLLKDHGVEPEFVILEVEKKTVLRITVLNGSFVVEPKEEGNDVVIINFGRILKAIGAHLG